MHTVYFALLFFLSSTGAIVCQLSKNKTELLNWCMDSISHKAKPGKEDALHLQCIPWKDKACCTGETTVDVHQKDMYNFTLDHCYNEKQKNMSDKCQRHFNQNNCFYECEPHIGYWVVKTKRKIARERFYKVPLCASDCDSWWEACLDDYTCALNWPRNFQFRKGVNYCRGKCITFKEMYKDAKTFCEKVWDDSWKYTPDNEPCIRMWFNSSEGNPNLRVAEYYIDKWLNRSISISSSSLLFVVLCTALHWIFQ